MAMRRASISITQQTSRRFPTSGPSQPSSSCRLLKPRFKSTIGVKNPPTTTTTTTATANAATKTKQTSDSSVPMAHVTGAMIGGIATVALTATLVEKSTASSIPPFDPTQERFDSSTFLGRFCKMTLACDPKLLLYSEEQTRSSRAMVENYKSLLTTQLPTNMTFEEMNHALWEAHRISTASLHPDTQSLIPAPFRMSGYVPFNGPICVAMVASTSTPAILFWSWVNQSQNALVNYFNRNAGAGEMSNGTMMKSYSIAVGSALTVAFGLATAIQK